MGFKKLEEKLTSTFQWYGELVAGRPLPFLLIPLILALILAGGLLTMKVDSDAMMLFTPFNAPSRREQQISRQFAHTAMNNGSSKRVALPMVSDNDPYVDQWFNLQVMSETNLMTPEAWRAISRFVDQIYQNFTCKVEEPMDTDGGVTYEKDGKNFILQFKRDLCNPKRGCLQLNSIVDKVRDLLNVSKYGNNSKIVLTYPVMYVWGHPFNWGEYIWGAKVDNKTGKLESAKVLGLYLQFQIKNDPRSRAVAESCMRQLSQFTIDRNDQDPDVRAQHLTFQPINEVIIGDEVSKIQTFSTPYLGATVVIIILFIGISSFKRRYAKLCILGAFMGVLTVGISLLASFGFLCLCGVKVNFVIAITPFLVLCVGIDNDFLITSAWRRTSDGHSSLQRRIGRAFADCGPSLAITSVNDILCFGVGYLSETPAVADFCLHTCVALIFRFVLQMTFFAAITVYMGQKEMAIDARKGDNTKPFFKSASIVPSVQPLSTTVIQFTNILPSLKTGQHRIHQFFGQTYTNFLMRKSVRSIIGFGYVLGVVLSIYGAASWYIEITPERLFFDDSVLQKSIGNAGKYVLPEAVIGRVYVTAPPDFRYKANVERFLLFVQALEDLDNSNFSVTAALRSDQTDIWLREYVDFYETLTPSDKEDNGYRADFYDYLPDYLSTADYNRYLNDLRFRKDGPGVKLDKFQFIVSYFRKTQDGFTYQDNIDMLLAWRSICANYSDYQAVVFDHFQMSSYYDQRLTLAPTCLQTMGIALLCMSVVTALLMPHLRSMFFICLSFLSVNIAVIAGLNAWSCPLDPTSMAFVLMTIGFSVYYTARVCYCYQSAHGDLNSREKMRITMETVGWPILQGALATLFGILPSTLVPCYMMRVFYRTIILIVLIGLVHGLVVLPIFMSAFDRCQSPLASLRKGCAKRPRDNVSDDACSCSSSSQ